MKDVILAIIASGAFFTFLQFLITRYDTKKQLEKRIDLLSEKIDEHKAILARTHILRFSDELQNGIIHSQEYFRQQMDDCDTYDQFCREHPEFANSYTVLAEQHIKDTYRHLLEKGEFKHD